MVAVDTRVPTPTEQTRRRRPPPRHAKQSDTARAFSLIRQYHGSNRPYVVGLLLLVLEAVTAILEPFPIAYALDFVTGRVPSLRERGFPAFLTNERVETIVLLGLAIILIAAVNKGADSLSEVFLARGGRELGYNIRVTMYDRLQKLSMAFHDKRRTGDVLTRVTGDVLVVEEFVVASVSNFVASALLLIGSFVALLLRSWQVALIAVVVVPALALVANHFSLRLKRFSKEQRAKEGDLASTAQEMLSSISLVQVYGRGASEERKFAQQSSSARDAILRTARLEATFSFIVAVLEAVGIAVVILVGARLVSSRALSAGDLIAFILLIQNMFKPIRRIIKQWNRVAGVYASVERVNDLLDRQPTVVDAPDARPAPPLEGVITFRDVSFAYQSLSEGADDTDDTGGRLALHGVSFRIPAGESVALVGHSGAGKSTIAQLLPRLYDPHVGAVLIDGHDIRSFTIESLRAQISMVLQETILLRGTVAENIAYGREGASPEEVVHAARLAGAHDFIMDMPDGYDTVLGERAATLSGGQRQRLAIARAFIRDAPILILDEPTTGLDAVSSSLVADSLHTLARDRSTLIVSHDLNLIRHVDRVLVMSAGQILEEGSPEDLLASGGLYAELYAHQFGEAVAASAAAVGGEPVREPAGADLVAEPETEVPEPADARAETRMFDTVLSRAVPLPATREQFLALTGWLPSIQLPSPDGDMDPFRSPALMRALPGLTEALSAAAMAPRLQRMLADDRELLGCSPGKAFVEPGDAATLQYRLEVRRRGGAAAEEQLVAGRVFPTVEAAQRWLARLEPLADQLAGRADLRGFVRPAVLVPELCLVLSAFPLDPELPGLVTATDPAALVQILGPLHTGSVPGLVLDDCHVEVVRYRRGSCVLRYELAWSLRPSRRSLKQVVYGKVYGDDRGRLVGPAVSALRHLQEAPGPALPFQVPRFQAYLPDLRLTLLESVSGAPLLPALIRAQTGTPAFPGLTAHEAVGACARVAAALHRSSIPVGSARTLADEIDAARAGVDAVAPLAPALAASLRRHLGAVGALGLDASGPLGVAHGDFDTSQVLFGGRSTSLVDFDTVCLAEPAFDLGRFTGHLAATVRRSPRHGEATPDRDGQLEGLFLREYLDASSTLDPDTLLPRVAAYRTVALVRLAVRSWCKLKPERLRPLLALLDEPTPIGVP